jgi:hypothetical protein
MAAPATASELEKLHEEVSRWKQLYEEQLRKNQALERRLRGEEEKPQAQRRTKSSLQQPRNPPTKAETEKDRVKNKLRLACSQNDAGLLQEAIGEAERLGMPEVEYARKKLATIS